MSVLEHLVAFITIITLTFFLLLEGKGMFQRGTGRLPEPQRTGPADRDPRSPRSSAATSASTWCWRSRPACSPGSSSRSSGFHLALPLAVLVGFLDLIPLIGLTVGGFVVAVVLAIDGRP